MRGKRQQTMRTALDIGITPADAGKTGIAVVGGVPEEDHPRGCGENWLSDLWGGIKNGSPPRMRGKPLTQTPCTARARITPADAGKTTTRKAKHRTGRDHPRGCGENVYVFPCVRNKPGSPPRMRGKPLLPQNGHGLSRITPADAGKTRYPRRRNRNRQDHPRGCGENLYMPVK